MERYTQIPTTAEALLVLASQMAAAAADYPAFQADLLTAKRGIVSDCVTDVGGKQTVNDEKNALYVSARNVYYAARDALTLAKDSLSDAANSLQSHINSVLAVVTAGMTAEQFAILETKIGLALTTPLLYLAPVAPVLTVAKWVNATTALLNWSPSVEDSAGHCAANAYLVEKSVDGVAFTFERVVIPTEVYITVGSNTHYRVTPVGDAGNGDPLTVLVSGFTPAS